MIVSRDMGLQKTADVENIMNLEVLWEPQFIGLRAYPLDNFVRSTVSRTEFLVLPK